jgi:hypothetical protein
MAGASPADVKKAIGGLKFHENQGQKMLDSEGKAVLLNGQPKLKYSPIERDMTEADVLSHARDGSVVTIVSKDGRKHRVNLSEGKEK